MRNGKERSARGPAWAMLAVLLLLCAGCANWQSPSGANGPFSFYSTGRALGRARADGWRRLATTDGRVVWVQPTVARAVPRAPADESLAAFLEWDRTIKDVADTAPTERAIALQYNGGWHTLANVTDWGLGAAAATYGASYLYDRANRSDNSTRTRTDTDNSRSISVAGGGEGSVVNVVVNESSGEAAGRDIEGAAP